MRTMFPRLGDKLARLGQVPLPPLFWFSTSYHLPIDGSNMLAAPPMRSALQALLDLAEATKENNIALAAHITGWRPSTTPTASA